jgi:hypothetical protein
MKEGTVGEALSLKKTVDGLMSACQDGSLQAFKKAAKDERLRASTNNLRDVRDDFGRGLLHQAAQMGHVALCQHMVEKLEFDVNDQDKKGAWFSCLCATATRAQP